MNKVPFEFIDDTHILYIIDRSGSMHYLIKDAVGGFNSFIEEQKKLPGNCFVTLIAFDNIIETIYDKISINNIETLTTERVHARGMTALRDAVGTGITKLLGNKKVIVLIMTDGAENSSVEWTQQALKTIIKKQEELGWEFQFVGVGIDAFQQNSANLGLKSDYVINFAANADGIKDQTRHFTACAATYRSN